MNITIRGTHNDGGDTIYASALEALSEERIFDISKGKGKDEFDFTEMCDQAFAITLSKMEVKQLAEELLAFIANETFCANCGKPADHLTRFDGSNTGWRDMRGMELCEKCLAKASSCPVPA